MMGLSPVPNAVHWTWTGTITSLVVFMILASSLRGGLAAPRQLQTSSTTVGFDIGASYRPPIIEFNYHGGQVMTKPINIYIVWYGSWATNEMDVIRTALSSLTPDVAINEFPNLSNLWKVMTRYYEESSSSGTRTAVTNKVTVTKEVNDDGTTYGKIINSDNDPWLIIENHITAGDLPADSVQGVYLILTAHDITFSNSNSNYCGYHSSSCPECTTTQNNSIYAFVPIPRDEGCNNFQGQTLPSNPPPNHGVSADGSLDAMVSIVMHELLELAVDPYRGYNNTLRGWKQNFTENSETADVCSSNYIAGEWYYCDTPSMYPDFNTSSPPYPDCSALRSIFSAGDPPRSLTDPQSGVQFNVYGVGGSQFLVQKMWSLDNMGCALQQPEDPCPAAAVVLPTDAPSGSIQRGYFFNGVGLQVYAPNQSCGWRFPFSRQVTITFNFVVLALAPYDDLDYIKVWQNGVLVQTLSRVGSNIQVAATGTDFGVRFYTDSQRSPYPASAGFIMTYTAV